MELLVKYYFLKLTKQLKIIFNAKKFNYNEIFALIVKSIDYKVIFAFYIIQNQDINYINIKTTFFIDLLKKFINITQL